MRVSLTMQRTANALLDVGSVTTAAASPRRFKLYEIICGSEATPADNAFLWQVIRRTSADTGGTAVTPIALDFSDTVASTLVGHQATVTNGGGTSILLTIPLNQRATFRWVAAPGGELIMPATASNGCGIETDTISTGTPVITATVHSDEV